ncbi:hypothetical protein V2J09_008756, partial [Rumex salicifolius]
LSLDAIKTKLQTTGSSEIYIKTLDDVVKTFQSDGRWGFNSGISTAIDDRQNYFLVCRLLWYMQIRLVILVKNRELSSPSCWCKVEYHIYSTIMLPKELITRECKPVSWSGALAGTISTSFPTSFKVVKTRLMNQMHMEYMNEGFCC